MDFSCGSSSNITWSHWKPQEATTNQNAALRGSQPISWKVVWAGTPPPNRTAGFGLSWCVWWTCFAADVARPHFDRLEWRLCWKAAEGSKKKIPEMILTSWCWQWGHSCEKGDPSTGRGSRERESVLLSSSSSSWLCLNRWSKNNSSFMISTLYPIFHL